MFIRKTSDVLLEYFGVSHSECFTFRTHSFSTLTCKRKKKPFVWVGKGISVYVLFFRFHILKVKIS